MDITKKMVDFSNLTFKKQVNNYLISDKIINKTPISTEFICISSSNSNKSEFFSIKLLKKLPQIDHKNLSNLLQKTMEIFSFPHENIVKICDILQTKENIYIIEEICNGGSLADYIEKNKGFLSEKETVIILKEIIKAFKYFNEKGFFHQGINPKNVMFHDNNVKISVNLGDSAIKNFVKTEKIDLIEDISAIREENYFKKNDISAVGVLIYKMLYGENCDNLEKNLKKKELIFPEKPYRSEKIKCFIRKLLMKEGFSWEEVFFDEVFEENVWKQEKMMEIVKKKENLLIKSFWFNKIYLEKNRVFHKIARNSSVLSIKIKENGENNDKNLQKNLKFVIKMSDYLIFERNLAIFYQYIAVLLFNWQNNDELFEFPKDIYERLLFLLIKCSLISMKRVFYAIINKIEIIKEKPKIWDYFITTSIYSDFKRNIQEDLEKIAGFSEEIEKKIREEISRYGTREGISMVDKEYLGIFKKFSIFQFFFNFFNF